MGDFDNEKNIITQFPESRKIEKPTICYTVLFYNAGRKKMNQFQKTTSQTANKQSILIQLKILYWNLVSWQENSHKQEGLIITNFKQRALDCSLLNAS